MQTNDIVAVGSTATGAAIFLVKPDGTRATILSDFGSATGNIGAKGGLEVNSAGQVFFGVRDPVGQGYCGLEQSCVWRLDSNGNLVRFSSYVSFPYDFITDMKFDTKR